MMLHYSVIDKRLRTYLGQVEGITHEQCMRNAKTKYETPFVRIDCYPSTPEYKGPPNQHPTESARVEEEDDLESSGNQILDVLTDPGYAHALDHRYTGELFGFDKDSAFVVNQGTAEAVLTEWAQRKFNLGSGYAAKVYVADVDLVVVVSKVE